MKVLLLGPNGQLGHDVQRAYEEAGRPFELEAEVTPPYGADHVVAVSASSALDGLNAALRRLDRRLAAGRAAALLSAAKAEASGWSSGVQGLYTAP